MYFLTKEKKRKEKKKENNLYYVKLTNRLKTSLLNYNTQNCEQMVKTKKGLIINAIPC